MQDIHDFVALRALFNDDLHQALLNRDIHSVTQILNEKYKEDLQTSVTTIEGLDIEKASILYQESLTDPDLVKVFL